MFQFPAFAFLTEWYVFNIPGCPIRKSPHQRLFAPTQSLSQLITSFIASESLGIHHTPLFFYSIVIRYFLYVSLYIFMYAISDWYRFFVLFTFQHVKEHIPIFFREKWRIRESNPWPPACKAGALANWANPPSVVPRGVEPRTSTLSV